VSSALACVGLTVSDEADFSWLLKSAYTDIREIGTFDGVHVGRWQDDSSAALLALGQRVSGPARITALGIDVTIYPRPAAYTASPDSHIPGTDDHPEVPEPGSVICGTVVLSGAIDSPLLNTAQA
jgi:hypothetical protein